jgi:hypothetical protein
MEPPTNLKDLNPEEIAQANDKTHELERHGKSPLRAVDRALRWIRRAKERDPVPRGIKP